MGVLLQRLEMPNRLKKMEGDSPDHGIFVAEPFESGYGYTIGNSLRRVLLSSIEGVAITNIRIDGVSHEFCAVEGIVEDITDIVLNLKQVLIKSDIREPKTLYIETDKTGAITAGDIDTAGVVEIVNPDQHICTITKKMNFKMDLLIERGRGYRCAEKNKKQDASVDTIAIDSIFTPVRKVKYFVEDTRVGDITDYNRLVMDVWTDGRISPDEALKVSSGILQRHLDIFVDYDENYVEFDLRHEDAPTKEDELERILDMPISEIELSVRSANCIDRAEIKTIRDLVTRDESEMLKYRNFGKKSLNEIKAIISSLGLSLGMNVPSSSGAGAKKDIGAVVDESSVMSSVDEDEDDAE